MQFYTAIFLLIVILVLILKLYLNYRQINSIKSNIKQVPLAFINKISIEEHTKAGKYNLAKLRFSSVQYIYDTIILLGFTLGGWIQLINDQIQFSRHPISTGVFVIIAYGIINSIFAIPFSLISIFGIEQKFGFNKTSIKLFIMDTIKNAVVGAIIGIPLLYLVLWIMNISGNNWWIITWLVLVAFNLSLLIIYPIFIAPLFNKFSPLEEGDLKTRIVSLLTRCGFKSNGIFIMDGSKRSSHGNAYFTGIGKSKRIVFFDTLIKQLTPTEIEAVLAHELGHFKHKHVIKQMLISFLLTLLVLYILNLIIKQPIFYLSMGVNTISNANALILFMLLLGVVFFPFTPISSFLSRRNEFEADAFAAQHSNKQDLISGLTKLYKDNASTLTPDDVYVKFYYSHPPASIRIKHLESIT